MKGTNVELVSFWSFVSNSMFSEKKNLIYFYSIKMRSLILALNFVPELQLFDIFCINLYLDIWWVSLSFIDLFGVRTFDHNYQMPNVFWSRQIQIENVSKIGFSPILLEFYFRFLTNLLVPQFVFSKWKMFYSFHWNLRVLLSAAVGLEASTK